jgi:hypothetical protein
MADFLVVISVDEDILDIENVFSDDWAEPVFVGDKLVCFDELVEIINTQINELVWT